MHRRTFARASVLTLTGIALVGASGCHLLKKKKDKILWSCTQERVERGSMSGTKMCTDVYVDTRTCYPVEKKADGPCKHDDAIAGCRDKDGDYVEWYYGFGTEQNVASVCTTGTTISATGSAAVVKTNDELKAAEAKKYMDESGPKAKATLATVATIAAKLPAPTGKVNLEGLKGDVLLVHKEDLGSLESPKSIPYRIAEAGKLTACSRLLNGRKLPSDEPYELSNCAKNPIIAVVSVTSYAPPTAAGSSVSGNTKTTFVKKGTISGDVLFFRTDNGKYLGSTTVGASEDSATSPQIMTERLLEKWPGAVNYQIKQAAPSITNSSFTLKKL